MSCVNTSRYRVYPQCASCTVRLCSGRACLSYLRKHWRRVSRLPSSSSSSESLAVGLVWSRGCPGDDRRSRGSRRDERDDEPEARRGGNVSEERASSGASRRRPGPSRGGRDAFTEKVARCCFICCTLHAFAGIGEFVAAMADFDAIYEEEEEENEQNLEEHYVAMVPDPIVIRGAGNMTV